MKKLIHILLIVGIVCAAYMLVDGFVRPVQFQTIRKQREAEIVDRLKDIRTAQRAYRQVYNEFTPSFDSLINFVLNDSMIYEHVVGSADDSVAVAKGLVRTEEFKIAVLDTIFGTKKVTAEDVLNFPNVPFSDGETFYMESGELMTQSSVVVKVFECRTPYKAYLYDLEQQELINLIDEVKSLPGERYPGLKVGSMTAANNESGNWE